MKSIPLLLIPVLLVHGVILAGTGIDSGWLSATLPSGTIFTLTAGTFILAIGLIALFAEVFKASSASRASRASLLDQALSLLLFVGLLLEFLLWPAAGNGVFVLLVLMSLVDVIAGFAIGLAVARRDVSVVRE